MKGVFITLEGGDGVGKTTQAELLGAWLTELGRTVVRTREPGGTDFGTEVREIVLHSRGHIAPRAEALLYAADRAHHIATKVRPALERGEVVVQDRYLDSSVAYQAGGRTLPVEEIEQLSLWAVEGLLPHATVLLDIDPLVGTRRLDTEPDRLERAGDEFHQRTRQAYLDRAAQDPDRWVVVDASGTVDDIHTTIREAVAQRLGLALPEGV